jgi:hypothetical protein
MKAALRFKMNLGCYLLRRRAVSAISLTLVAACVSRGGDLPLTTSEARALADTVLTIVDSLVAVHQTHPDTALLGRLYPGADTILYVEGGTIRTFTGDSLLRRTLAAHAVVRSMSPRILERQVRLLDRQNAILSAVWDVDVVDTTGTHHPWRGPITLAVSRRGDHWVIRSHRE